MERKKQTTAIAQGNNNPHIYVCVYAVHVRASKKKNNTMGKSVDIRDSDTFDFRARNPRSYYYCIYY